MSGNSLTGALNFFTVKEDCSVSFESDAAGLKDLLSNNNVIYYSVIIHYLLVVPNLYVLLFIFFSCVAQKKMHF